MSSILFLSYDGLTDNLGRSQIIPYLNAFCVNGHRVHVISVDKHDLFSTRRNKVEEQLDHGITWVSLRYSKRPKVISTLWDLRKMKREALKVMSEHAIDIIHVRSYPPMGIALFLKRKFKARILFDMRGFYPEERIEGEIWKLSNPIFNFLFKTLKKREDKFLDTSDHIISLTEKARSILIEEGRVSSDNVSVIPCCADFQHFRILERHAEHSKINIIYLGSLGTWYMIPEMLQLFKRILNYFNNAEFHIISGDDPTELEAMCIDSGLDKEKVMVYAVEREDLPQVLSNFDFSIFLIKPSYSKQASSPTKLAELLACGIPVLCNHEVGDIQVLSQTLPGIKAVGIEELQTLDIESTIIELKRLNKQEIRTQAMERFDISVAVDRYLKIYSKLAPDH